MDISNDNNVLNMFGRNANRVVFDVFVELAEEEGESGDESGDESEDESREEFGDESEDESRKVFVDKTGETNDQLSGDEMSDYKSYNHCESKNQSDSELEDDPLKGSLNRDGCMLPSETGSKIKLEKDGVTFQVKTYVPNHTCVRSDPTSEASADWIATKIESVLRENSGMKTRGIRNELKRFGVNPQYMQIYRAKKKALESIEGSYIESFGKMPYYANLVLKKNEGSVVTLQCDVDELEVIPSAPVFKRFFLGLSALRDGFLEGCSPFLGFDGCHSKGPFEGCY
ncbi:UNVERIFIED_CONTAM: hypothetical protein Slati_3754600 [Sesamum latifolium]|uniref:Uncharacterized protein n=1 Tax=Sesamum latifolium TaxID=2727402 RepID=A0AAW2U4A3_9LAMI